MLRTILINPVSAASNRLRYLADGCGAFQILCESGSAGNTYELQRALGLEPEIVIIALQEETANVADWIHSHCPDAILIGIGGVGREASAQFSCRLQWETGPEELLMAVAEAIGARLARSNCQAVVFLPAKAGCGASTVALNTAACLARTYQDRVLLIDADLRSSVLTAMAGRTPATGIEKLFDEMDNIAHLEIDRSWVAWQGVHLLLSTRSVEAGLPSAGHYLRLLNSAAGRYEKVILDLPELINPATLAAVRACEKLFLVTTTELPALTLAQQRLGEMGRLDAYCSRGKGVADASLSRRIEIVVNRWQRSDLNVDSMSRVLGNRTFHRIGNDYRAVKDSFESGEPVGASKLREAIEAFTREAFHPAAPKPGFGSALQNLFGMNRIGGIAH